jgi:uncharacterized membrane protein
MFQWLFKYPVTTFSKGEFVLQGRWPKTVLCLLVVALATALALLIRSRLRHAATRLRGWRIAVLWTLQSSLVALLLLLLWQPAITVAELKPQQNIIAILIDDSRSMAATEHGITRLAQAVNALQSDVLDKLNQQFQVRLYTVDTQVTRAPDPSALRPAAPATHLGDSLRQFVAETSDLPIGAIVLLSDGSDNSGGIDLDTITALRNRRIPVHTVGLGPETVNHDIEMDDAVVSPHTMAGSRLNALITIHQHGFARQPATIEVRNGTKVLASRSIVLGADGKLQLESLLFNAGDAGAKPFEFSISLLPGEENRLNNSLTRLVNVEPTQKRILYIEGEPRWVYKFIRRAEDSDQLVQIASILRTTENDIYRQGIRNADELKGGFPSNAEELFAFQGLIIGSVQADYFTPAQKDLIHQFVDRRGGGLLFLGGRFSLADGGWGSSSVADALPVVLPNRRNTFHRASATVELTPPGMDSLICRLIDDPAHNAERWKTLPFLMDYQEAGTPKPGAVVLAEMKVGGRNLPFLTTENFGRGRTAVLASSGNWRWQMSLPLGDTSHDRFWQQLLRWLVSDTLDQVVASVPNQILFDDGQVKLSAAVRGKTYLPTSDATVEAHIIGPGGISARVDLSPVPNRAGEYQAQWTAPQPGSYLTEVTAEHAGQELGRNVLTFQRMNGVAENFHTEQNRDLLERLSADTGGRYWRPQQLSRLPSQISYSEAGITVHETKALWNMPVVFLMMLLLTLSEWFLRRRWGVV